MDSAAPLDEPKIQVLSEHQPKIQPKKTFVSLWEALKGEPCKCSNKQQSVTKTPKRPIYTEHLSFENDDFIYKTTANDPKRATDLIEAVLTTFP
jgi:hypothetical protein